MKLNVIFNYNIKTQGRVKIKAVLVDNESVFISSITDLLYNKDVYNIKTDEFNEIEKYALNLWFEELEKHKNDIKIKLNQYLL